MSKYCCKIGCKNIDLVAEQEIAFVKEDGSIVRSKIRWCKEHQPECILDGFEPQDLLRHGGY